MKKKTWINVLIGVKIKQKIKKYLLLVDSEKCGSDFNNDITK